MDNEENSVIPSLQSEWEKLPLYEPSLIRNVLRRCQKLIIKGPGKSGKTSLVTHLAVAVAEGTSWLDNECSQGGVLFVNFGMLPYMMFSKVHEVYSSLNIAPNNVVNIDILNYRGSSLAENYMDFVAHLQSVASGNKYRLIIIDSMDHVQGFHSYESSHHINRLLDNLMIQTNSCVVFTTSSENPLLTNLCDAAIELIPTGEKAVSDFRLSIESNTFPYRHQQFIKFNYPTFQRIGSSYNEIKMAHANEMKKEKAIREFEKAFYKLSIEGEAIAVSELAERLGITRESLYRKVKKLDNFRINLGMVEAINVE